MKYFLKFLALMGLTGAMIYSLFIHGDISSYGFWLWTLVISVSLITLGNYASLIGALNCKMNDQDEDEKGLLILSTFLSSLIFSTIFFYSISAENPDWIYLLCSFILYLMTSGFNKRTFAFVFVGFTQYVFFCSSNFEMNTWHIWAVYLLIMIAHIVSIITVIADRMDSDSIPMFELFGLLIPVLTIIYAYYVCGILLCDEITTLLLFTYTTMALLSSIRDDSIMFGSVTIIALLYLYIYPGYFNNIILLVAGIACTFCGISHMIYKSRILTVLSYSMKVNENIVTKYNNLVQEYNQIISDLNNSSYYESSNNNGSDFESGFLKGLGTGLGKVFVDTLSILVGG